MLLPSATAVRLTAEGEHARAAMAAEAAKTGDLVVATVPLHAYDRLPAAELVGRTASGFIWAVSPVR